MENRERRAKGRWRKGHLPLLADEVGGLGKGEDLGAEGHLDQIGQDPQGVVAGRCSNLPLKGLGNMARISMKSHTDGICFVCACSGCFSPQFAAEMEFEWWEADYIPMRREPVD